MAIIRDATERDIASILVILNDAIETTTASWDHEKSTPERCTAWYEARRAKGFPVLVAEEEGNVIGFASFDIFRPFQGFLHTAEHSIYVARDARRQGAGRALIAELAARARALDMHVLVAGIEANNAASIALHQQAGFEAVGRLPQVGRKFNRWLDLVFMQKALG
ncbi:N-acyltransferase YncA [Methyloligella halotolerans]|uniref:N-acyltransferase YncA n=1 Tax=Methyloligella halotolerans TaxID=1177755 RepID=A0A1E2RZS4_9HYPH|nr:GNAT family N-acetyltransferase [Methyloligella halotolerans]ODA67733.1 N-acyltransferase YncA [Methyloligella halotolerans]